MRSEKQSVWRRLGRLGVSLCLGLLVLVALAGCDVGPVLLPRIPTPTATATVISLATSTDAPHTRTPISPQAAGPTVAATSAGLASATLTPTLPSSPTPTASASPTTAPTQTRAPALAPVRLVQRIECASDGVTIGAIAGAGRVASISGTAAIPRFAYYKIEYQPSQAGDWSFVARSESSVTNGLLHAWDTAPLAPGRYRVRLTVVDATGNYPAPCVVEIEIR